MTNEEYIKIVKSKYGSFENDFNSQVYNFYRELDTMDSNMIKFLENLNNHGLSTVFSCSGHGSSNVKVSFATYITMDKIDYEMGKMFPSCVYQLKNEITGLSVKYVQMLILGKNKHLFGI